ncbi:hypothetical protein CBL_09302 [Carabus blaptoides fortunei]
MGASLQDGHSYYLIDNRIPGYNPYYYNPYINTYVNSYNYIGPLQYWPNIVQPNPYRYLGQSFYPSFNVQCYIVQHIYLCCSFNVRDLKCIALQELYPRAPDYDYDDGTNGSGDDFEIDDETENGDETENSGETETEDITEANVSSESGEGTPAEPVKRSVLQDDKDFFEF